MALVSLVSPPNVAAQNVLTYQYDNARAGTNTNEVVLTPANVNATNLGRLFTYPLDGYAYAHPLYVSHVEMPGEDTHNVVFVATENDTVYAFDADSDQGANGGLLWQTTWGLPPRVSSSAPAITTMSSTHSSASPAHRSSTLLRERCLFR